MLSLPVKTHGSFLLLFFLFFSFFYSCLLTHVHALPLFPPPERILLLSNPTPDQTLLPSTYPPTKSWCPLPIPRCTPCCSLQMGPPLWRAPVPVQRAQGRPRPSRRRLTGHCHAWYTGSAHGGSRGGRGHREVRVRRPGVPGICRGGISGRGRGPPEPKPGPGSRGGA